MLSKGSACPRRKDTTAVRAAAGPRPPQTAEANREALTCRAASRHFCMEISSGSPWYSGTGDTHGRSLRRRRAGAGRGGPGRVSPPPLPANLRSIFFATNVYGEESPRI